MVELQHASWVGKGLVQQDTLEDMLRRHYGEPIRDALSQEHIFSQQDFIRDINRQMYGKPLPPQSLYGALRDCDLGIFARPHIFDSVEKRGGGDCWRCDGQGLDPGEYDEPRELWTTCTECEGRGYVPTYYVATCERCKKTVTKGR